MPLIIVESPTKAKTFNAILKGTGYHVFATMGHFRDLPKSKIGIDYAHEFTPTYQIIKEKQAMVEELQKLTKKEKEIILATDPDREGESISYHIAWLLGHVQGEWPHVKLKPKTVLKRIVFHEITEEALKHALENPEALRLTLIEAQQARRILDRIVGYELSPLLWKKMGKYWLSAGRVQTVALRLIVEREKEITAFPAIPYFQMLALFQKGGDIEAKLTKYDTAPVETKKTVSLFAGDYTYTVGVITPEQAPAVIATLEGDQYIVSDVRESVSSRTPPSPYTTSLLQQDGFQKAGYSSKMTMRLAQNLYEHGLITYHRTDSVHLSDQFVNAARSFIHKTFGKEYVPSAARQFKTKSKMAQEAHEAIRPTKLSVHPEALPTDAKITSSHKKLYKLIYERAVASQMSDAHVKSMKLTIHGVTHNGNQFEADAQKVLFDGFLRLANPEYVAKHQKLYDITPNAQLTLAKLTPVESQTKAPPRYNDASLIKTLEEKGIGRPSTYSPILLLIQEKNYVEKDNKAYRPTALGTAISDYLSDSFPQLFNLDFTAEMEQQLDDIAEGSREAVSVLKDFASPFRSEVQKMKKDDTHIDIEEKVNEVCDKCGSAMVVRFSRFGKFLACSKYPECKNTKPFLMVVEDKKCPKCTEGNIVVRYTKSRRKFYGCSRYPDCDYSTWKLEEHKEVAEQGTPVTPVKKKRTTSRRKAS